jgi:hypothetical protein
MKYSKNLKGQILHIVFPWGSIIILFYIPILTVWGCFGGDTVAELPNIDAIMIEINK